MTKKLDKMLESKGRKNKKKKTPRKNRAKHRGIIFNVGEKRAMEILYDMIRLQRHRVPVINLFMDDPAADFCINMYSEISTWDYHHLVLFIEEITGKKPEHAETASLLGTAKSIFHALFMDEDEATKEQLLRYDSKWKMWPGEIRRKPKRRKSKMATKKAARKKTSTKRASRKKTSTKKSSRKRVAKKGRQVAKKKAASNGRTNSISAHEGKVSKMLRRRSGASVMEVVDSVGISKKSVRKLFGSLKAKKMKEEVGRYYL